MTENDNKICRSISCIISICILLMTDAALEMGVVDFMRGISEDRIVGRIERMDVGVMCFRAMKVYGNVEEGVLEEQG